MKASTLLSFRACLTLENLDGCEDFAGLTARLVHAAKELQRYAVLECNRNLSEREQLMQEHMRTAATVYSKALGLRMIEIGGDPRGHVVKVELPSGRSNHWGGATWAVLGS